MRAMATAFLALVCAAGAGAAEGGFSLAASAISLHSGGYYTHDDPGYAGYSLSGSGMETSIAYRAGRIEAEVSWAFIGVSGSEVDRSPREFSAGRLNRGRLSLGLRFLGPAFAQVGFGRAAYCPRGDQAKAWNRSDSFELSLRLGAGPRVGERFDLVLAYDFALALEPGGFFSSFSLAGGESVATGSPATGFSSCLLAGLRYRV